MKKSLLNSSLRAAFHRPTEPRCLYCGGEIHPLDPGHPARCAQERATYGSTAPASPTKAEGL